MATTANKEAGHIASSRAAQCKAVLRPVARAIIDVFIRYRHHYIWEALLDGPRDPSVWPEGQRFYIVEPDQLDAELNPHLWRFLGGAGAAYDLGGVRKGDRLLLVSSGSDYAFYGYIYFDTTSATRRQKRMFSENNSTPVIGTCFTAKDYRGIGIYRRVLNDTFRYLYQSGYSRATADVNTHNHPSNKASAAAGMTVCRELVDWLILKHLLIQKVKDAQGSRWRVLILL